MPGRVILRKSRQKSGGWEIRVESRRVLSRHNIANVLMQRSPMSFGTLEEMIHMESSGIGRLEGAAALRGVVWVGELCCLC